MIKLDYVCSVCGKEYISQSTVCCGKYVKHTCEKKDCHNPAIKSVYALGYMACVCQYHYDHTNPIDQQSKSAE